MLDAWKLAAFAFLLSGRLDAIEPAFVGSFRLIERNGQALSIPMQIEVSGSKCAHRVVAATLEIDADDRWSEWMQIHVLCEDAGAFPTEPFIAEDQGEVKPISGRDGEMHLFSADLEKAGITQVATATADRLFLTVRGDDGKVVELVYARTTKDAPTTRASAKTKRE